MDCTAFDEQFASALSASPYLTAEFPPEARGIISRSCDTPNNVYLETLAKLSVHPIFSSAILTCYESIFPELVARWPALASRAQIAAGFGRVLPAVPYLCEVAEYFLLSQPAGNSFLGSALNLPRESTRAQFCLLPASSTLETLLALHRLLCFRRETFLPLVDARVLYHLLHHPHRPVPLLAVRVLCIYLGASDAAQERMLETYGVGRCSERIEGQWEGREVDYWFLMSLEAELFKQVAEDLGRMRGRPTLVPNTNLSRVIHPNDLSQLTVDLCGVLTLRLRGVPRSPIEIVDTPTTRANVRALALALRMSQPILITGYAGAGKTFLVHQIAHTLNALGSMVSIHLGDQTDAKLLIGTYATADTPGNFEWRPGVLITAVREGRWVLVEDIDKAPTEVLSVLLPLIERGELDLPSRGEKIRAARGFRLITTARTSLTTGRDIAPVNLLGSRLWARVNIEMPAESELQTIVNSKYPLFHTISHSILSTYTAVQRLYREPSFFSISRTSLGRQITPRDLFKWCNRVNALFTSAGVKTGKEVLPDGLYDEIFSEAADCFAGSLHTLEARRLVVGRIAEELHIPSQRVGLLLSGYSPSFKDSERTLAVGRAKLKKRKDAKAIKRRKKSLAAQKRPFAMTNHALRLLEQVGVAVRLSEPVLLVGETGTGKTTVVQQLADMLGCNLTAINLSQQTESGDLLGGYKPIDVRMLAVPLKESFDVLFEKTFSLKKNRRFLDVLGKCWTRQQWKRIIILWGEAVKMAENFFAARTPVASPEDQSGRKKRKLDEMDKMALQNSWAKFSQDLAGLEKQSSQASKSFVFSFVEGSLVKAARNGDWVLLDEINLAAPDTLESIADLLKYGGNGSILLSEKGDVEKVQAHPDFRIFACMNPATDVGKRDLPAGLRSRFTELYVTSPDSDFGNLVAIVTEYIGHLTSGDARVYADIAQLYMEAKKLAESNCLVDGATQKPHFSVRTLARTLSYAVEIASVYGLRRSLYEGFCMSFLTLLDRPSEMILLPVIDKYILGGHKNVRSLINQVPRQPSDGYEYVQFKHYWMHKGAYEPEEQTHYIITPSVERNMLNLVRATATRKFPVLVQGPTSSGKTSMIEYLAKKTGHKFMRINNHEHTDLQEYLGTYVSDSDGKLSFREGILVEALRKGHWIVLDELNLAPTDVLEALNRLLDDNRELLIPETQEVVRPHKDFMLFATQNPPGLYGGRKILSRAFRNRFLELHFDDIPEAELGTILKERCQIAPSYGDKIVKVYKELSVLRQSTRLFEQKNSFATLRDLFRWANRRAEGYQQLAENGYMLLAERVRKDEEKLAVKQVLEKVMRVTIDVSKLYTLENTPEFSLYAKEALNGDVVWTSAMQRLFSLVAHALRNNEPVLLVGETGCGKTTVCQMLADAFGKRLVIVNAHQNTETGDIIGAQRPIRNRSACQAQLTQDILTVVRARGPTSLEGVDCTDLPTLVKTYQSLDHIIKDGVPADVRDRIELNRAHVNALFEWAEGPLVQAMKQSQFFLLDEISLADDSVLERLNSVLEPARGILLAEKGPDEAQVTAADGFQFFATMNPGGDYGKKELSPALRNRFTEIWVPSMTEFGDVMQIVRSKLKPATAQHAKTIVKFAQWFSLTYNFTSGAPVSIRDVLAWTQFVNLYAGERCGFGLLHGAALVFFDGLGANPSALLTMNSESLVSEKYRCIEKLSELCGKDMLPLYTEAAVIAIDGASLRLGPFCIRRKADTVTNVSFSLEAPTTATNAMKVIRAMQLRKPILLEGNPGVGKTSLITTLAGATGNPLTRINLSEQTDLMDLFGSDVPVEGGQSGEFAWRDAPFLRAMQKGYWVLLDEMNLASQSVLEGLNACLDHRGEVYIPELDRTFSCHPDFAVFAAQNPHHQGGGRKGLPASFVNRFTVVYVDVLNIHDLQLIARNLYPNIAQDTVKNVINFVVRLGQELEKKQSFGVVGGPWEFNLRDTLRWLGLLASKDGLLAFRPPGEFLDIIVKQRFRAPEDRSRVDQLFAEVFGYPPPRRHLYHHLSLRNFQIGHSLLFRRGILQPSSAEHLALLKWQLPIVETLMTCIQQRTPCVLVGASGTGKSSMIKLLACVMGEELDQLALNADIDTTDIVGGFEQVDISRKIASLLNDLRLQLGIGLVESLTCATTPYPNVLQWIEWLDSHGAPTIENLQHLADRMKRSNSHGDIEKGVIQKCEELLVEAHKATIARFEWVDGLLVKAVEEGKWLVLDNANLCSSSVLDRLNSLLERNGSLVINEHSTSDGNPKVVTMHPNFRLFITMDPKHGELSRAMRNRCVEVFVDPSGSLPEVAVEDDTQRRVLAALTSSGLVESNAAVFQQLDRIVKAPADSNIYYGLVQTALEHVPKNLLPELSRWRTHIIALSRQAEGRALVITEEVDVAIQLATHPIVQELTDNVVLSTSESFQLKQDFTEAQLLNPLRNSSLFLDAPATVSLFLEVARQVLQIEKMEASILQKSATVKPAEMTFLEKSASRQSKMSSFGGSVGVLLFEFLIAIRKTFGQWFNIEGYHLDPSSLSVVQEMLNLWRDLVQLSSTTKLNESIFHVYLSLLEEWVRTAAKCLPNGYVTAIETALQAFKTPLQLSTGLSMERIWVALRPSVPNTLQSWDQYLSLKSIMERFDLVGSEGNLDSVLALKKSLVEAAIVAITDSADLRGLVGELGASIKELEKASFADAKRTSSTCDVIFDLLLKFKMLHSTEGSVPLTDDVFRMAHFAKRSTESLVAYGLPHITVKSSYEPVFGDLWLYPTTRDVCRGPSNILTGRIVTEMLRASDSAKHTAISQLQQLETETNELSKQFATHIPVITSNKMERLTALLLEKLKQLFVIHRDSYDVSIYAAALGAFDSLQGSSSPRHFGLINNALISTETTYLRAIAQEHLVLIIDSLAEIPGSHHAQCSSLLGKAWIHYAMACTKLYVTNVAFDPAMKPMVERDRHLARTTELQNRIEAEKLYEAKFTGQDRSRMIESLLTRLDQLGANPPNSLVARPRESEMSALQGELSNVLRVVVDSQPHIRLLSSIMERSENYDAQEVLFQKNLSRLVERLEKRYPIYRDMIDPVIGFLYYLKLGFSLAAMQPASTSTEAFVAPFAHIPELPHISTAAEKDAQILWLQKYALRSSTEGYRGLDRSARQNIHTIFQRLFGRWKMEMIQDKERAAATSSLYTYRGEPEDFDDQEFQKMFPTYERNDDAEPATVAEAKVDQPRQAHRDVAVCIAESHAALFSAAQNHDLTLSKLVCDGASVWMKANGDSQATLQPEGIEEFLPAVLLSFKDTAVWLRGRQNKLHRYDFYNDENLEQAHRLVAIVKKIHQRITQILEVWPENITLQDALGTCQKLLDFPSVTPVAKFITKVEKLHEILNEWQGVSSREYSVAEHYDALTQLIISWRRLELTTWPTLFDIEEEKAMKNALSWWFFLYESIIANPLELLAEDLKDHIHQLISNLVSFIGMSSAAQFSHRLQLIRNFEQHILRLSGDFPDMKLVRRALHNFITYYSQYENTIRESFGKDRNKMEKDVAEVVLLASWKDTNILALRESAKRSHHKLYKIVRKYRQALDSPALGMLQSMSNEEKSEARANNAISVESAFDIERVKAIYEQSVKAWDSRPRRVLDLSAAVNIMQRVSRLPDDRLDVTDFMERFSASVISTVKELQMETPSMMSEEVKDKAKHIKTRKRKAFTDVLKELRHMGLKSNLSRATLQKQGSLERILSAAAILDSSNDLVDVSDMQHYFVRTVEVLLKLRNVKEPSPDLTGQDVARVSSFVEHLVSINMEQRASLSTAIQDLGKAKSAMRRYKRLSDLSVESTELHGKDIMTVGRITDAVRKFRWLPKMLEFTGNLLFIHSDFAGVAHGDVGKLIGDWGISASELDRQLTAEEFIHEQIWQASSRELIDKCEEFLDEVRSRVNEILTQTPAIRYALKPLLEWTSPISTELDSKDLDLSFTSIQELDRSLQNLCDSIFVALQRLSEAQSSYPVEAVETGWLLKSQRASAASLEALYMGRVSQKIEGIITQASRLQPFTPEASLSIRAVFAAYVPVVEEYVNICYRVFQGTAAQYRSTCKATYVLSTTANNLLSKGFCAPPEQGDDDGGESKGTLEQGTGLGEGEGAQDISKDIKDDEDLSELAQEADKEERKDKIEDEEDAVDMGQDDMEGEMGDMEQKEDEEGSSDEKGEENEKDEETGDVDDLDPTAVDEKMWDEKGNEDDKEKEGESAKGKQHAGDELEAKKENPPKEGDIGEQGDEADEGSDEEDGAEQDDDVRQQDAEGMDEYVPEVDTLDLPEDMQLDGDEENEKEGEGDDEDGNMDMDDLSNIAPEDDPTKNDKGSEGEEEKQFPDLDGLVEPETEGDKDKEDKDEDEDMGEEHGDGVQDEEPEQAPENPDDNRLALPEDRAQEAEETVPSDVQATQGGADNQENAEQTSAQQEVGDETNADDAQGGQGADRNQSQQQDQEAELASMQEKGRPEEQKPRQDEPSRQESTFRKVGDILEKWHRQRKQILDANEEQENPPLEDTELDDPEFEHLPNEDARADTQALGAATEEQAHGLDESMATDSGVKEPQEAFEDEPEEENAHKEAGPVDDPEAEDNANNSEDVRAGAMIGDRQDGSTRERQTDLDDMMDIDDIDPNEPVEGLDLNANFTNLALSTRSREEARKLWQHYESATRTLSAGLCEQLRLILEPTLATKMRGDFRTGKRLNMRRIIPYIASSYKKDKIWMRRAKPSKRQYQVILAVDDSKSMAEGNSSSLAMETVTLVARALSSLEVGQISLVSFGESTQVVHPFDKPFTSDSGAEAFSRFTFAQQKTDVRLLVETSLELFSAARSQASADLWQLEIVISDGVCEEHDMLRRLVRKAQEQRVMIVFVVVDSVRENSILKLNRVSFVGGDIKTERYLDGFPFGYYLVVSDIRELPGVLAGALRQWFAESVENP